MKQSAGATGLSPEEIQAANTTAKSLIVLKGEDRPVLDYLIKNVAKADFKRIILITGAANQQFLRYYADSKFNQKNLGVEIFFAIQKLPLGRQKPYGTADALLQTLNQYPELKTKAFAVCNSDNLYSVRALKLLKASNSNNAFIAYDRAGLEFSIEKIARFALCKFDDNNLLLDIVEKPEASTVNNYADATGILRVSMNVFKFTGNDIFPYLEQCPEHPQRKEKELPTAIMNMIKSSNGQMMGIPLKEHVPDLTTKADIAEFKKYL